MNLKRKMIYITHDAWWNSDLPILSRISKFYRSEVFVFSSKYYKKLYPKKECDNISSIFEFERKYKLKNPLSFIPAWKFFKAIYKRRNSNDILLYVFSDDLYFNLLFYLFVTPTNTIISIHNYTSHTGSSAHEDFFKKLFLKKYNNFHFQSKIQNELFRSRHPFKKSFHTVMPSKYFGSPKNNLLIKKDNLKTFLFFGLLRDYKRVDLFINAANKNSSNAHYVIAGYSKDWDRYSQLIQDKSKFTCNIEFIDNDDIADYFNQADFLILPYNDTTQSGPLLIAYAYGLPVIASDLEMFKSMIDDGVNGYLFKSGDVDELAKCLSKCSNLRDNEYKTLRDNQVLKSAKYEEESNSLGKMFLSFTENTMK